MDSSTPTTDHGRTALHPTAPSPERTQGPTGQQVCGVAQNDGGTADAAADGRLRGDAGMATAEYAMATLAAVAFAGLLLVVLKSNAVKAMLTSIIEQALTL